MKKVALTLLRWLVMIFVLFLIVAVLRGAYAFRDRAPGYKLDLSIKPSPAAGQFRAGFARANINPDLKHERPVWVAGFSQNRPATGIHDDLWAIACVLDDGKARLGFVVLDAIGFFHDDVIAVRRAYAEKLKLDYVVVCSTHNHSTPDLMGLWGPGFLTSGVDPDYRRKVIKACGRALADAAGALVPAKMVTHELQVSPEGLVTDTRQPYVYDSDIRVIQFFSAATADTIGTIVSWGNHPETVWSKNQEITSDFCGYLRDALRDGIKKGTPEVTNGVGGIHLYVNGAVGGLMTTSPSVTVKDPISHVDHKEPTHDKARALGHQLAIRILPALRQSGVTGSENISLGVEARTFVIPVDNFAYLAASYLGLMDRGYTGWRKIRTEAALLTIGDVSVACIPGEIYPEIVNGGVEAPSGADFGIPPLEVPPIRQLMPGKAKFVFGLANDEIGYLVPKSQWDAKPPYTYGSGRRPYGEVNSCGPEAAPIIHRELKALAERASQPSPQALSGGS